MVEATNSKITATISHKSSVPILFLWKIEPHKDIVVGVDVGDVDRDSTYTVRGVFGVGVEATINGQHLESLDVGNVEWMVGTVDCFTRVRVFARYDSPQPQGDEGEVEIHPSPGMVCPPTLRAASGLMPLREKLEIGRCAG